LREKVSPFSLLPLWEEGRRRGKYCCYITNFKEDVKAGTISNKETRNSGKIIDPFFELFPAPAAGWLPNS